MSHEKSNPSEITDTANICHSVKEAENEIVVYGNGQSESMLTKLDESKGDEHNGSSLSDADIESKLYDKLHSISIESGKGSEKELEEWVLEVIDEPNKVDIVKYAKTNHERIKTVDGLQYGVLPLTSEQEDNLQYDLKDIEAISVSSGDEIREEHFCSPNEKNKNEQINVSEVGEELLSGSQLEKRQNLGADENLQSVRNSLCKTDNLSREDILVGDHLHNESNFQQDKSDIGNEKKYKYIKQGDCNASINTPDRMENITETGTNCSDIVKKSFEDSENDSEHKSALDTNDQEKVQDNGMNVEKLILDNPLHTLDRDEFQTADTQRNQRTHVMKRSLASEDDKIDSYEDAFISKSEKTISSNNCMIRKSRNKLEVSNVDGDEKTSSFCDIKSFNRQDTSSVDTKEPHNLELVVYSDVSKADERQSMQNETKVQEDQLEISISIEKEEVNEELVDITSKKSAREKMTLNNDENDIDMLSDQGDQSFHNKEVVIVSGNNVSDKRINTYSTDKSEEGYIKGKTSASKCPQSQQYQKSHLSEITSSSPAYKEDETLSKQATDNEKLCPGNTSSLLGERDNVELPVNVTKEDKEIFMQQNDNNKEHALKSDKKWYSSLTKIFKRKSDQKKHSYVVASKENTNADKNKSMTGTQQSRKGSTNEETKKKIVDFGKRCGDCLCYPFQNMDADEIRCQGCFKFECLHCKNKCICSPKCYCESVGNVIAKKLDEAKKMLREKINCRVSFEDTIQTSSIHSYKLHNGMTTLTVTIRLCKDFNNLPEKKDIDSQHQKNFMKVLVLNYEDPFPGKFLISRQAVCVRLKASVDEKVIGIFIADRSERKGMFISSLRNFLESRDMQVHNVNTFSGKVAETEAQLIIICLVHSRATSDVCVALCEIDEKFYKQIILVLLHFKMSDREECALELQSIKPYSEMTIIDYFQQDEWNNIDTVYEKIIEAIIFE